MTDKALTLGAVAAQYRTLAVIGMCKNAGKTTALNFLTRSFAGLPVGLTSAGRDGESTDAVTGTPKPLVFIYKNMLGATASQLLARCTASRQILCATGISTPLGEVVIFRALSDGFAELAGPSTAAGLKKTRDLMLSLGAEKVIIDGALNRKSVGAGEAADAVILSTGASYDKSMETVISDTLFACGLLALPRWEYADKLASAGDSGKTAAFDIKLSSVAIGGIDIDSADKQGLAGILARGAVHICLGGALTDSILEPLIRSGANLEGRTLVMGDSAKILASRKNLELFLAKKGLLRVIIPTCLAAVTINPASAYGWSFDAPRFKKDMQRALEKPDIPVFNVEEHILN